MILISDLRPGDPITRAPSPYRIQVVQSVQHASYCDHREHPDCRISLVDAQDHEPWILLGVELTSGGWFRAALDDEYASAIGATPASAYELEALRWTTKYNPRALTLADRDRYRLLQLQISRLRGRDDLAA